MDEREKALDRVKKEAGSAYEGMEADLDTRIERARRDFPSLSPERAVEVGADYLVTDIRQDRFARRADILRRIERNKDQQMGQGMELGF